MISIDLHSHSTASDGLLSPTELIKLAAGSGVKVLALTDHDDVSGLPEAALAALTYGVQLVNGVEISASWHGHTLHIVGLHIDPLNSTLSLGLEKIRAGRKIRARRIADSLAEAGIVGAFEGARRYAGNPHILNRSHFARYLVEAGYAKNVKAVFEHFLTGGKPGYVRHEWVSLAEAVGWICASGGVAVIAHPGRYILMDSEMHELLAEFCQLGGRGIEVVTSSHKPEQFAVFAKLANQFGLLASKGSDFHGPGESRFGMGNLPELPSGVIPIWHDWSELVA